MQSQAISSGIKLPEVHGMRKNLDPNLRPEKQHTFPKQGNLERLYIDQGTARSKRKKPDQAIKQPSNLSQKIPGRTKMETRKTNSTHTKDPTHSINNANDRIVNNNPFMPNAPFHPDPLLRPAIKPIKQNMTCDENSQNVQEINSYINFDFKENTISRRHHVRNVSKTGQIILSRS